MPKYFIHASEAIYYMMEIEANSKDDIRKDIDNGVISFEFSDAIDGQDFTVNEIEVIENA